MHSAACCFPGCTSTPAMPQVFQVHNQTSHASSLSSAAAERHSTAGPVLYAYAACLRQPHTGWSENCTMKL